MKGSIAYRSNEAAIWAGRTPEKYHRLLPYITGLAVLEIGAAEGVLSLLLAQRDPAARVIALERRVDRHEAALALKAHWLELGRSVKGCHMVVGDIRDRLDLLQGIDTLVASRTIYYLRESVFDVFATVARHVPRVVLAGNPNRAQRYREGIPDDGLGPFNFYASVEGMTEVLERSGYTVGPIVREGDPIVVGHR